ncbi:hypothetical protein BKA93DRAFT_123418 [Sparassis latifolia]
MHKQFYVHWQVSHPFSKLQSTKLHSLEILAKARSTTILSSAIQNTHVEWYTRGNWTMWSRSTMIVMCNCKNSGLRTSAISGVRPEGFCHPRRRLSCLLFSARKERTSRLYRRKLIRRACATRLRELHTMVLRVVQFFVALIQDR